MSECVCRKRGGDDGEYRRGEEQEEEGEVVIRHPIRNGVAENRRS